MLCWRKCSQRTELPHLQLLGADVHAAAERARGAKIGALLADAVAAHHEQRLRVLGQRGAHQADDGRDGVLLHAKIGSSLMRSKKAQAAASCPRLTISFTASTLLDSDAWPRAPDPVPRQARPILYCAQPVRTLNAQPGRTLKRVRCSPVA